MEPKDRVELALEILNSESFACLMSSNPCHRDLHIFNLQDLWRKYCALGGGFKSLGGCDAVRG
jgi:hypothetical protein